jgi:serine/threonine-protein kinase HipA
VIGQAGLVVLTHDKHTRGRRRRSVPASARRRGGHRRANDHLRNHGFLHDRGDVWRLSPAFDLNPDPAPGPKYLSTAIDDADDAASVTSALGVADYFRLFPTQARRVLRHVATVVEGWRTTAARHQLTPSEIATMEPAFAGLAQVDDV